MLRYKLQRPIFPLILAIFVNLFLPEGGDRFVKIQLWATLPLNDIIELKWLLDDTYSRFIKNSVSGDVAHSLK